MHQETIKRLYIQLVDSKPALLADKFHLEYQLKLSFQYRLPNTQEMTDSDISSLIDEYYNEVYQLNLILDELEKDMETLFVYRGIQPLK